MKGKVKASQIITQTVIDSETGEIKQQTESRTFTYGKEPDFIKVYLDNIMLLAEIPNWISKVLYELIKAVTYAEKGHFIVINPAYKRLIAENLGMKTQSVTNAINTLSKQNILIKRDRGLYLLNPHYFGRGDWKDIARIRYEIELTPTGKRITKAEIENEEPTTKPELKLVNGKLK
jgi:hypothetical protein